MGYVPSSKTVDTNNIDVHRVERYYATKFEIFKSENCDCMRFGRHRRFFKAVSLIGNSWVTNKCREL